MRAGELMTRELEVVGPEATLQQAAERMRACGIGTVVVMDGAQLVGILTDRDITVRATARGLPSYTRVHEVMTTCVVTCPEDAPLAEAEQRMEELAVRRLVVLDRSRRPVGLLSLDDFASVPSEAHRAAAVLSHLTQA